MIAKDFINNITIGSQRLARWRNNGFSSVQQGNTSDAVVAVQGDEYWVFDYNKLPTAVITLTADQSFSYSGVLFDYLLQKIPSTGRYIGILTTQGRNTQYYFRYVVVIDGKGAIFRLGSNNGNTDMLLTSQSGYRTYLSAGDVVKFFEF